MKKYKRLRNNGDQSGGWATLEDDDDSVSAQAELRERIWQLESDVSALLLVDARRRLADRRQTLIDSNKGKAIAAHQKYAQPQIDSLSKHRLAEVGKRCVLISHLLPIVWHPTFKLSLRLIFGWRC